MDIAEHNRRAWNKEAADGGEWSTPVAPEVIERARRGEWEVILTPNKPVPVDWFPPDLRGKRMLCLASGGGQQAPVLAAAGAIVTSFDNSDVQLAHDRSVGEKHGLDLVTIRGDMADLSPFENDAFDLVFHAVSNVFVPSILPVWKECHRVLAPGGSLLAGFMNPAFFLFDHREAEETGALVVHYPLPYSDLASLDEARRRALLEEEIALEYSHSLEDQIGGQIAAGFLIAGLYEDDWDDAATPLNRYMPAFVATRAVKAEIIPSPRP